MKIEKIQKTGSKYKITLENKEVITTYDEVIIKYGLLFHKDIDLKLLDNINNDTNYYKSYNKALDMINKRLRSEYEIRQFLKKNEISEEDTENIIKDLKKIGLIDDKMYAKAYTNDKINLTIDGPYKIKKHLEENKIAKEYIEEAINSIDIKIINSHIDKIISKKINSNTKYTPYMLKQKIINYLISIGYSKKDIIDRLETFEIKSPNTEKEMDKIYNKLKNKFEGDTLYLKLKTKLYSKGYTKEEIENYINKNSSLIWAIFSCCWTKSWFNRIIITFL